MIINDMFVDDINRQINGVIKVNQTDSEAIEQEVREYVITRELKKHFITFFDYYSGGFDKPIADIGVWISGFFGSGKSHFLKMLSYILENRRINGKPTVEYFREKLADDPGSFMLIDKATHGVTETILFNIDIEGSINKTNTAVLRVFAKMFYNHLGFYGENLKVAKLEQFISKKGKYDQFKARFEEINGFSWESSRDTFAFIEDDVVSVLGNVLGMSENAARDWFNGEETVETSIAQLVSEIKEYVATKPKDFRLLFMIDEVGQYVGTDVSMLLNLQSLSEQIGTQCGGKVWILCTGQSAIDEIIKVREEEFSRIQARFKTRLPLSSSSVDEVIQKRILKKTDKARALLEEIYSENDSVLRNLFSFSNAILDIKGYGGYEEFVTDYPFVPYQFLIIQKVFAEIRRHGNSGKHLSGGERSMLSGFQEAVQAIKNGNEYELVPFYRFYDTIHTFLDETIRRVIVRCDKAADAAAGLEKADVNVLKLLYLLRYIEEEIKATLDNVVILMADDIRTDKIALRKSIQASLDRLLAQNYIARTGEYYHFLTDDEQDIQRAIRNTTVERSKIKAQLGEFIYGDIYQPAKFKYGKYDFPFNKMVDDVVNGSAGNGMTLQILSVATDDNDKTELNLLASSKGRAIALLPESPYYDDLEQAMKIRKYVAGQNVNQKPKTVQDIIRDQQAEAGNYEDTAKEELQKALAAAQFYVDGEHIQLQGSTATEKLNAALKYLVSHVYSELELLDHNVDSDQEVAEILSSPSLPMGGVYPNSGACAKIDEYLEMQSAKNMSNTVADLQSRYQAVPYGWREIDIAAVLAQLIADQKVTLKYAGETVQPSHPKILEMLRKKGETGKVTISRRQVIPLSKLNRVRDFLREYFGVMTVPKDEDGLVKFIIENFTQRQSEYTELRKRYDGHVYPDLQYVQTALELMSNVLSQKSDNMALIDQIDSLEDDLSDNREDLQNVESFFASQVALFDSAVKLAQKLSVDADYLPADAATNDAFQKMRKVIAIPANGNYNYRQIPSLTQLTASVNAGFNALLQAKRTELFALADQCVESLASQANGFDAAQKELPAIQESFQQKRQRVKDTDGLALLDSLKLQILDLKDKYSEHLDDLKRPPEPPKDPVKIQVQPPAKNIKVLNRQIVFPAKRLESEADVNTYVENLRQQLLQTLKNCDGIQLN